MTDQPPSKMPTSQPLFQAIRDVVAEARQSLQRTVNHTMVQSYWEVGRLIVEDEQKGAERAAYGKKQLESLSQQLTSEFGKGFSVRNLRNMRAFFLAFPIRQTLSAELSWSHYCKLITIESDLARAWYMKEAAEQNWSVRALERQVGTLYYERLLATQYHKQDIRPVLDEATEKTTPLACRPEDYLRDPYILDFLNLPCGPTQESVLEQALINNLQSFLLELGKGFAFVERQQRIRTEDRGLLYIDLVFYHFKLKCFLLIDLKIGKAQPSGRGADGHCMCASMTRKIVKGDDDNPTIGLILCAVNQ